MRSDMHCIFLKGKKKKQNLNTLYLHIFHLKPVSVINSVLKYKFLMSCRF